MKPEATYDSSAAAASASLIGVRVNFDHELVQMIFYHLRQQFRKVIDDNVDITPQLTNYINEKVCGRKPFLLRAIYE